MKKCEIKTKCPGLEGECGEEHKFFECGEEHKFFCQVFIKSVHRDIE